MRPAGGTGDSRGAGKMRRLAVQCQSSRGVERSGVERSGGEGGREGREEGAFGRGKNVKLYRTKNTVEKVDVCALLGTFLFHCAKSFFLLKSRRRRLSLKVFLRVDLA